MTLLRSLGPVAIWTGGLCVFLVAQDSLPRNQNPQSNPDVRRNGDFPPGGPGGFPFGPPGGPPGGPGMRKDRELVKQFDADKSGWLNRDERDSARKLLEQERAAGGGRGFGPPGGGRGFGGPPGGPGGGPPGFGRENLEPARPGIKVRPEDVQNYAGEPLYSTAILRTVFLNFADDDWEQELETFHGTDVEIPATLIVDGVEYPLVGVHFRGMSSYMMVPAGRKRSLNVSLDLANGDQRLDGYKTLNLLNCHEDESMMGTVLYSHIARQYLPAPKANFLRVVINGENWGIYANAQQFDKKFLQENYPSAKGTRWKVTGSPMGGGGLEYLGDRQEDYERRYEMKTNDPKAWGKLIEFCRVLNTTPLEQLEAALDPLVDMDELLWFLAVDNALINCDGYWIRASDYNIFLDESGKFHIIPHDMNEAFRPAMGPGMGGPPGGGPGSGPPGFGGPPGGFGFGPPPGGPFGPGEPPQGERPPDRQTRGPRPEGAPEGNPPPGERRGRPGFGGGGTRTADLDPLIGLDDPRKPLRSRILSVPRLQARYLAKVRQIAEKDLDCANLGPVVAQYRELIAKEVAIDTRKLGTLTGFQTATSDSPRMAAAPAESEPRRFGPPGNPLSLRNFADQRREHLLKKIPDQSAVR